MDEGVAFVELSALEVGIPLALPASAGVGLSVLDDSGVMDFLGWWLISLELDRDEVLVETLATLASAF